MRRILIAWYLVLALLTGPAFSARANLPVIELSLKSGGLAYEIHPDGQGHLWITDYRGELWHMNGDDGTYQVYAVGGQPSDATPDHSGNVWWVSGGGLYRMNAESGSYAYWDITGGSSLWSVAVDYQGRVWANDDYSGMLYRLDPFDSDLICGYSLGTFNQGYLEMVGDQVWVADTAESRIYRLDPLANRLEWWSLPPQHNPYDLAADGSGTIWYTNSGSYSGFGGIGRLDTYRSQTAEYSLPSGYGTKMLTTVRGKVWYTEFEQRTFGRIDPLRVEVSPIDVVSDYRFLAPSCSYSQPAGYGQASPQNGWTEGGTETYSLLKDAGGWQVYQMTASAAAPVGIAMTTMGWVVDSGRNSLARFDAGIPPLGHIKTYIPAVMR